MLLFVFANSRKATNIYSELLLVWAQCNSLKPHYLSLCAEGYRLTMPGYVDRDSSVGIATRYGLGSPGIESRWGEKFSAPVQTGPVAHPASCTMGTGSFRGVKRLRRGADSPPPSSAEVKEKVQLYFYSSSTHSWTVAGWNYTFTFTMPVYITHRQSHASVYSLLGEDSALPGCDAAYFDKYIATFRRNIFPSFSRINMFHLSL